MSERSALLLRHGESVWNAEGRWQGLHDPALSDTGRAQARATARHLRDTGIQIALCSDLVRAVETAAIIAQELALPAPSLEPRLRERDAGEFAGLTWDEIEVRWPDLGEARRRGEHVTPVGANNETFDVDAVSAVDSLLKSQTSPMLLVSHGGFIRVVVRMLGGNAKSIPNVGGVWIHADGEKLVVGDYFEPDPALDLLPIGESDGEDPIL